MSNQVAVSIVIPCFNHGHFVREAISSVEKCDNDSVELIIVNDGSTDTQTQQVMRELESDGYHVINQPNQGLAAARNNGIRESCGKYVLPLDADNLIRPDYIHQGRKVLDSEPGVSVVYGKPAYFGDDVDIPFKAVSDFDLLRLIDNNFIDACALFRRSAWEEVGGYDMNMPAQGLEDWDFWLSLSARGHRFVFIDEELFDYRVRRDSMLHDLVDSSRCDEVVEYMIEKHPLLALHRRSLDQEARLNELEMFVEKLRKNPLFKIYHRLKYLGRS